MQTAQASLYRSFDNKSDLKILIREQAKLKGKDMKKYTNVILDKFEKKQLYRMFASIEHSQEN